MFDYITFDDIRMMQEAEAHRNYINFVKKKSKRKRSCKRKKRK